MKIKIDQQKILEAVERAEKKAATEIVTLIVPKSDGYSGARWRLCIGFFLLLSFILAAYRPHMTLIQFFTVQVVFLIPCYCFGFVPWLLRNFLSDVEMAEEVEQRAIQAFISYGVHETKNRSGILIMASRLEHRVWILADKGFKDKVGPEVWNAIVEGMIVKIKAGNVTDAFVEAVEKCGEIALTHFPRTENHQDQNQFSNAIKMES